MEAALKPIQGMRRRARMLLIISATLAVFAMLIGGMAYANRPRWRSYTSPPIGNSKRTLTFQMPDNWVQGNWTSSQWTTIVNFQKRAQPRLITWFYNHIFHLDQQPDEITVRLNIDSLQMPDLKIVLTSLSALSAIPGTVRESRCPLGPTLEFQERLPTKRIGYIIYIFAEGNKANCMLCVETASKDVANARSMLLESAQHMRLSTHTNSPLTR